MTQYCVTKIEGVTLIAGDLSLRDLADLLSDASRTEIADMHLAQLAKVKVAFGEPEACEKYKKVLIAQILNGASPRGRWIDVGMHGKSAMYLYSALRKLNEPGYSNNVPVAWPRDVSDLQCCRQMLEMEPQLAEKMSQLSDLPGPWMAILEQWTALCQAVDDDTRQWGEVVGKIAKAREMLDELLENATAER
jgi:hypothetical protein